MTEIEETIKSLEEMFPKGLCEVDEYKMAQVSIDALEKQIAKKPIMKPYFDDMEEEYLCCPTCGEALTDRIPMDNNDFYFHCFNCGQKFDWSDSD